MNYFNRPKDIYKPTTTNINTDKYKNDRDNIPPKPISAEKIDSDFNNIIDCINNIWGINIDHKYNNILELLVNHENNIEKNNHDINNIVIGSLPKVNNKNDVYMSRDGKNLISDKIDSSNIKEASINNEHISENIHGSKILDNSIDSSKIISINPEKIANHLISSFPNEDIISGSEKIAISSIHNKNRSLKINDLFAFIQDKLGKLIKLQTGLKPFNIVQLDNKGKLPKLDASNLFNYPKTRFGSRLSLGTGQVYKSNYNGLLELAIVSLGKGNVGDTTIRLKYGENLEDAYKTRYLSIYVDEKSKNINIANASSFSISKDMKYVIDIIRSDVSYKLDLSFVPLV